MAKTTRSKAAKPKMTCGIVMPISSIDGCNENHWSDVLDIISESIEDSGFEPNLVSNADEIGVIQKRIIQNLYDNPIVVCDVSGKNPNVMFELGIRLAFDKPTIIIKDDKTSYSFDTSPIEHLEYPRDLRFNKMIEFKEKLTERVKKTYEKSQSDDDFSTFLKHFGEFKVAKIDKKEVSEQEFILDELRSLRSMIYETSNRPYGIRIDKDKRRILEVCLRAMEAKEVETLHELLIGHPGISSTRIKKLGSKHTHIEITGEPEVDLMKLRQDIQKIIGRKNMVSIRQTGGLRNWDIVDGH